MAFSSRRRNYLLTPHRKDGLIEWMKSMLNHSFVLDALDTTAADTFSHFEMLIDEHRKAEALALIDPNNIPPSRLKQLVPTVGTFHTHLPLRKAFIAYNKKYALTKRKFISISFNELRHILNLAQIMALRTGATGAGDGDGNRSPKDVSFRANLKDWENSPGTSQISNFLKNQSLLPPPMSLGESVVAASTSSISTQLLATVSTNMSESTSTKSTATSPCASKASQNDTGTFKGPKMITFDGDQTLYSDGANFEGNPELANYLYLLLRNGVTLAVVTAAGYEYEVEKYETRLSGLLSFFKARELPAEDCERFYLFGGECNYLLKMGSDYRLHPVKEHGAGGWITATRHLEEAPGNWDEDQIQSLLDVAEESITNSISELNIRGRCLRKKRAVGMIASEGITITREALDESVLRVQEKLDSHANVILPFCAFNGGSDVWIDCGNKRVGVSILASYLGMPVNETIHVGDQFLNTGNDFAARDICPCIWITNPDETTYILKSILRLAGASFETSNNTYEYSLQLRGIDEKESFSDTNDDFADDSEQLLPEEKKINFSTMVQRHNIAM
mmetsp:Transcript_10557/g.15991  ORF Transcript_10557/g.15991 Transcript_10557/m.15991 type:complete len:564 (+) Transcript_10557:40-1731(+)|eukprot:CAMPEP_0194103148 /NCGR_PEP_ID=MMETSP0150-20130528/3648_1 /TAXON_ID=122233 /ORGANISM="Chaetoceros debilis, Strain MM31A-1" /LENGTH=563 /DNA_ID=CAMNT_0038790317 /DNA_START=24 /DNA_END=1715 /DNA_ORIENTATION=+